MAPLTATVSAELLDALKRLRLGRMAQTLPERLVLADKQNLSFEQLLVMILTDEISRRDNAAADRRATDAGLDPSMRLELWDKTAKVSFDKRVLSELVSLRFLEAHRHVCILGPVGVGKTFLASALGHIACRHGYNAQVFAGRRGAQAPSSESVRQLARRGDGHAHNGRPFDR